MKYTVLAVPIQTSDCGKYCYGDDGCHYLGNDFCMLFNDETGNWQSLEMKEGTNIPIRCSKCLDAEKIYSWSKGG
jgi:hypothetical protein